MTFEIYAAIGVAVASAVGSIVTALLSYKSNARQSDLEGRLELAEEMRETGKASSDRQAQFQEDLLEECRKLRDSNASLQERVVELQVQVQHLEEKLDFYEKNHLATEAREMLAEVFNKGLRGPAWIHDLSENKWYLNDQYCRLFGVTRDTFWTPVNIVARYDPEDAIRYSQNDFSVIEANMPLEFRERVRTRITDPKCKTFIEANFRKVPYVIANRPYVMGKMLDPVESLEEFISE